MPVRVDNIGAGISIGGGVSGGTSGSVLYVDSSGNLAQDNSNFAYDATNKRLGLYNANLFFGTSDTFQIGGPVNSSAGQVGITLGGVTNGIASVRAYRITIYDAAGAFQFYPIGSTTEGLQFVLQNYTSVGLTNFSAISPISGEGQIRFFGVSGGTSRPMLFTPGEGGGQGLIQMGPRPLDYNAAVGASTEFWPKSGQSQPVIATVKEGAGTNAVSQPAYRFQILPTDGSVLFGLESSTTNGRSVASIIPSWVDSTDATRKGRLTLSAYDTAAREGIRLEASGTAPMIGFLGNAAVAQQVAGGVTAGYTANVTANNVFDATTFTGNIGASTYTIGDIVAALKNYGLLAA